MSIYTVFENFRKFCFCMSIYEDSYFETLTCEGNMVLVYILRVYSGLECSDRFLEVINRKYSSLRIDIDV